MRTLLQILFGVILGVNGIVATVYLGLLLNGPPDLRAGIKLLTIIVATQWVSYISFRRHIVLPVFCGVALCMGIAIGLLHSRVPMFWEIEVQPLVYLITWRSCVAFLSLIAFTQAISFLLFRFVRKRHNPTTI